MINSQLKIGDVVEVSPLAHKTNRHVTGIIVHMTNSRLNESVVRTNSGRYERFSNEMLTKIA
jgi:hypothetical protein